jgi:hypothetical protein
VDETGTHWIRACIAAEMPPDFLHGAMHVPQQVVDASEPADVSKLHMFNSIGRPTCAGSMPVLDWEMAGRA